MQRIEPAREREGQDLTVWRRRCRLGLFLFYAAAGVLHITVPRPFLSITPSWVPDAPEVILVTGLCEIAGAIGLLVPWSRRYAGIGLALYAACVFPANIKHAVTSLTAPDASQWQWLYHMVRLPLQPVLIWIALFAAGIVRWPMRARD
ncbi:DoxX family protein [Rhizobium sp. CFBP 8752]|uniref:DoxX family protein n=1 Tax=unclassified Rhizobium TaxID=2613769 RepID=UPI0017823074|nr:MULTISPECIES: DoxX family protein [unclassified Rhizobium]MBD8653007.1 DoxX family protein [Rhizobium sp. CFBP 13726]MBD8664502.1 DoxX family protein [Rhizobium sp. CFBP 8752]